MTLNTSVHFGQLIKCSLILREKTGLDSRTDSWLFQSKSYKIPNKVSYIRNIL